MNRKRASNPTAVTHASTVVAPIGRPPAPVATAVPLLRTAVARDRLFVADLQRKYANQLGFLPHAALDELVDGGRVLLALENGEPAGYLASRTHLRCQPSTAPIVQAAVCYDARRRALGTRLVEAVCQDAWVAGSTVVQCWCAENLDACDFWSACGFTAVADRDPKNARGRRLLLFRRALPGTPESVLTAVPRNAGWKAATIRPDRPSQLMLPFDGGLDRVGLPDRQPGAR